jgi:predicted N-acetyltransferase YhbS
MKVTIKPLTKEQFEEAVGLVLRAELDTREEIEHHLEEIHAHYVAMDGEKIVGVVGWYQDNVNYANEAMGDKFPGEEAFWVGFFAVEKEYRGQHIGRMLIQQLEKVVREKGANELWVSSVPESVTYYEKHGFVEACQGKISGQNKHFMVKKLKG